MNIQEIRDLLNKEETSSSFSPESLMEIGFIIKKEIRVAQKDESFNFLYKAFSKEGICLVKNNDIWELSFSETKSIIFELTLEEDKTINPVNDLLDSLLFEVNSHLFAIYRHDENYFKGCDAEYLCGEWKELLCKIEQIVKSA
jgi:hypothetical protein